MSYNIKKVVALCGSVKAQSSNMHLINAIALLAKDKFTVTIFDNLTTIPHFNPDLDNETPPQEVTYFRNALQLHDGILICTPEYAMGVPGTLKNAIDWTVSSMEFSKKPTALITASTLGQKAHHSLLETLHVIEAKIIDETQLVIPSIKTKITNEYNITHASTLIELEQLINAFYLQLID